MAIINLTGEHLVMLKPDGQILTRFPRQGTLTQAPTYRSATGLDHGDISVPVIAPADTTSPKVISEDYDLDELRAGDSVIVGNDIAHVAGAALSRKYVRIYTPTSERTSGPGGITGYEQLVRV